MSKVKEIKVTAKEWFDEVNGNSYFSAIIEVEFKDLSRKKFKIPFQYGYGTQYEYAAFQKLINEGILNKNCGWETSLSKNCRKNNIKLSRKIIKDCTKKEVKELAN